MSEPVKVEEPVAATVPATAVAVDEPVAPADLAAPSAPETTEPVPVVPEEKVAESATVADEVKEQKPEPKEITQGTLSKAHGGLLSFFKQKRFFYFLDEPVTEDKLQTYLHKDSSSTANAAYASQTGKGLLFYSKAEGQKEAPHGIIKLADVVEVLPVGNAKFVLKLATGDLHFEAPALERDSWVFTLKSKISEAKTLAETVIESEGYTVALKKLSKPTPVATARPVEKAPEKPTDTKQGEETLPAAATNEIQQPAEADVPTGPEEETSTAEIKSADGKDVKRSSSKIGKRSSVFANFLGKKEKAEEKAKAKEEAKEEPAEDKKEEPKEEASVVEPSEAPVTTSEITPEEKRPEDTVPAESKAEDFVAVDEPGKPAESSSPKPAKRHSFFGGLFAPKKEETVEAKKEEKITEPTVKDSAAHLESGVEGDTQPEDIPAETPAKDKSPTSSPPKAKFLSNIFEKRDKSPGPKPVAERETEPMPEPTIADSIAPSPAETAVVEGAAEPSAPATSPKEKRKSSFFSFKKEKKAEDVKSDSEEAESAEKPSTSPAPKGLLTGLMRKASRSAKGKETESKDVAAPTTVLEESATEQPTIESAEPVKSETNAVADAALADTPAIGDVVPDAVTVGASQPVQAAA